MLARGDGWCSATGSRFSTRSRSTRAVRLAHRLCRHGAADVRRRVPAAEPHAGHVRAVRDFHGRRRLTEFASRRALRHAPHFPQRAPRVHRRRGAASSLVAALGRDGCGLSWCCRRDHGGLQPAVSNFGAMAMEPVGSVAGIGASLQGFISTGAAALVARPDRARSSTAASCRLPRGALCCGLIAPGVRARGGARPIVPPPPWRCVGSRVRGSLASRRVRTAR